MRPPQGIEWVLILAVVLLLFGAKRLPDAARGLGRSLRIFKAETKAMQDDDAQTPPAAVTPPAAIPVVAAPAPVVASPAPVSTPAAAPAPADQNHV